MCNAGRWSLTSLNQIYSEKINNPDMLMISPLYMWRTEEFLTKQSKRLRKSLLLINIQKIKSHEIGPNTMVDTTVNSTIYWCSRITYRLAIAATKLKTLLFLE